MTVLFADLVDSTAIASALDAEDFANCITEYLAVVQRVVREYGGHVGNLIGDGLLAYFGYPTAREDDAQGACLAGLAIVQAVGELRVDFGDAEPPHLAARVGINTGTALIGAVRGNSSDTMAMGEAVNLAARVQTSADPGTVVVSAATQRLVADRFVFIDKGDHAFKGIANPTRVFELARRRRASEQVPANRRQPARLIGRDPELQLMLARWDEAAGGSGRVVTLIGDAGLGKSRLVGELLARVADESVWFRARGSSFTQGTTLSPIIDLLQAMLAATNDSEPGDVASLERSLEPLGLPLDPSIQLLASLFGVSPLPDTYRPLPLTPQIGRQATLRLIVDVFAAIAARHPVLVVLEAAHWLDPTSFDLLDQLAVRLRSFPMLLVMSSRTPLPIGWAPDSTIVVNHLAPDHAAELVRTLDVDGHIDDHTVDDIVEKADGNPFYLEQLAVMVLDSAASGTSARVGLERIPSSLNGLLLANLDLGSSSRSTIQAAAAIGRHVPFALLRRVVGGEERQLIDELDARVRAGHFIVRGHGSSAEYTFRHGLLVDAAEQSMTRPQRVQINDSIAEAMIELGTFEPEQIARHLTLAGRRNEAVRFWLAAGQTALGRFALVESRQHLERGLQLVEGDGSAEAVAAEIELRTTYGVPLMLSFGFASEEMADNYQTLLGRCEQVGADAAELVFPALWGLWTYYEVGGHLADAEATGERLLDLASTTGSSAIGLAGHCAYGAARFLQGDVKTGRHHFEAGLAMYDRSAHSPLALMFGQDGGAMCASFLTWIHAHDGDRAAGDARATEALELSEQLGQLGTTGFVRAVLASYYNLVGDYDRGEEHARAVVELGVTHGMPHWEAQGKCNLGWALCGQGSASLAIDHIESGLKGFEVTGTRAAVTYFGSALAAAQVAERAFDAAQDTLDWLDDFAAETGERFFDSARLRITGDLQRALGRDDDANTHYTRAVEVARAQGADGLAAQAIASLAR